MSNTRTIWAICAECHQPTGIPAYESRGTPYHGECWLLVLRRRWKRTKNPATRASIRATAEQVAADLRSR